MDSTLNNALLSHVFLCEEKGASHVIMTNSFNFKLDRVPPNLKAARRRANLDQRAKTMANRREQLKAEGYIETSFIMPRHIYDRAIEFQTEHGLPTRGHAVAQLLEIVFADSTRKETP